MWVWPRVDWVSLYLSQWTCLGHATSTRPVHLRSLGGPTELANPGLANDYKGGILASSSMKNVVTMNQSCQVEVGIKNLHGLAYELRDPL